MRQFRSERNQRINASLVLRKSCDTYSPVTINDQKALDAMLETHASWQLDRTYLRVSTDLRKLRPASACGDGLESKRAKRARLDSRGMSPGRVMSRAGKKKKKKLAANIGEEPGRMARRELTPQSTVNDFQWRLDVSITLRLAESDADIRTNGQWGSAKCSRRAFNPVNARGVY